MYISKYFNEGPEKGYQSQSKVKRKKVFKKVLFSPEKVFF